MSDGLREPIWLVAPDVQEVVGHDALDGVAVVQDVVPFEVRAESAGGGLMWATAWIGVAVVGAVALRVWWLRIDAAERAFLRLALRRRMGIRDRSQARDLARSTGVAPIARVLGIQWRRSN